MRFTFSESQALPEEAFASHVWCVYGVKCFPQMLCCKLKQTVFGPVIWGFSIYKRQPGFRTLGQQLTAFTKQLQLCEFFTDHDEALAYMKKLTTPLHLKG